MAFTAKGEVSLKLASLFFIFTNIIIFVKIFIVRRVIHDKLFIKADNCDFRKRRLV